MTPEISDKTKRKIDSGLLKWFDKNQRPMPWRSVKSPYRTFISEVMLQQTQIRTVIPYFERWIKIFPDVETLAKAPIDQVLKLWEGLGYYTRARNLHKSAQIIVEKHGGQIPSDVESLMTLPGIGRYTAGAISSIAFEKPAPIVDGNVARVLSRLFNIHKDILKPDTQKLLYEVASEIVPLKRPGDFNQALMELGSLVCVPILPNCAACPLASVCSAYKKGNQDRLPVKSKAAKKREIQIAAAVILNGQKILVRKRPSKGIWGGLWEIPSVTLEKRKLVQETIENYIRQEYKLNAALTKQEVPIAHHLTHLKMTIHPFRFQTGSSVKAVSPNKWVSPNELKKLSFPVPYQKIIEARAEDE